MGVLDMELRSLCLLLIGHESWMRVSFLDEFGLKCTYIKHDLLLSYYFAKVY